MPDGVGVAIRQPGQGIPVVEAPGIEKIGADTPRLEGELPEHEVALGHRQLEEPLLEILHREAPA